MSFDPSAFTRQLCEAEGITPALSDGLGQLLAATGSSETRAQLAADGSLQLLAAKLEPTLAEWCDGIAPGPSTLLQLTRVLRNLCAAGDAAGDALSMTTAAATVARLVDAVLSRYQQGLDPSDVKSLLSVAAQLAANMAAASAAGAAAMWSACFPAALSKLALINLDSVQGPVAMALITACKEQEDRCQQLCSPHGQTVLQALLGAVMDPNAPEDAGGNEWLNMLLAHLVLERGLLRELLICLGGEGEQYSWTAFTLGALHLVQHTVQEEAKQAQPGSSGAGSSWKASLAALVQVLQQAAADTATATGEDLATAKEAVAVALAILRALSEVEGWRHSWAGGADVLQQLADDGVVPVLLGMLRDLRPIQNPRRQQQVQQGQLPAADGAAGDTSSSRAAGQEAGEQAASAAAEVVQDQDQGSAATASSSSSNRTYPHEPSYPGYRSDIVAVLANASCERPSVQQEVLQLSGVELLLSQCQLDEDSPLTREWALFAIRNLSIGNTDVQERIKGLELQTAVQSPEMERAGVKVDVDKATGKLKVMKATDAAQQ